MTSTSTLQPLFRFIIITGFLFSFSIPLQAQASGRDSLKLTKQKVRDWIQTRITTARLQNKMKANAAEYDDVVQAFFAERKKLLASQNWSVSEFESTEKRIFAATSAMDMADDLKESSDDHKKEIAEIKKNDFFSEEQKQQMIKSISTVREQKRERFIKPTKPDWPAVQPYRSQLEKLTDWIAGNIPDPPVVE